MRQPLVEAQPDRELPDKAFAEVRQLGLIQGIAATEHHHLDVQREELRQRVHQQINAFLKGQP